MSSDDKIIPLWLLVFNQNPEQAYLLASKAKVFASVEGLVRSVSDEVGEEAADGFVRLTLDTLEQMWGTAFIPMKLGGTQLFVHRLEIDRHNPIHQALTSCRAALESDFAKQQAIELVDGLLVDPVALGG